MCQVRIAAAALVRSWSLGRTAAAIADHSRGDADRLLPTTQRHRPSQPHQDNRAKTPRAGHQTNRIAALPMECGLAL